MSALPFNLPIEKIRNFCRQKPILRLSLFGSALRDDFNSAIDVDLLVEYLPQSRINCLEIAGQENELSDLIGHKVDLRTPQELHPAFRQNVLQAAQVLYEKES